MECQNTKGHEKKNPNRFISEVFEIIQSFTEFELPLTAYWLLLAPSIP